MSDLRACPKCGRKEPSGFTHNWFPVHTCRVCGEKYCNKCGAGDGKTCPDCGATEYSDYDKVYAE